ncbi:hypothetical protein K491DRAFT_681887 [Lophiostoma macrostomum CBS 122681]|uniref:Uncharacterized protein n=1 Tax=Lophiostoma macrostomum CBS 122681 TaxID=1314788 RepID=A0A6A6SW57_9PLEO|nr:hypothetical protein K491DRAFT_681887 [Lophiostoma macrostomum CBS 122681]
MATCLERWLPGTSPHDHRHSHDYDYDYDHDNENLHLAKPIFSIFPTSDELRSAAASRKCSPIITPSSYPPKRKSTSSIGASGTAPQPSPPARSAAKRSRFQTQTPSNLTGELHQSTCLNLTTPTEETSESDLWILPDFDEWVFENDASEQELKREDEAAQGTSLLQRAVQSNRERLRRRLEGDGWDFVGGRYGEGSKVVEMVSRMSMAVGYTKAGEALKSEEEESVDEEFDVVVLPISEVAS